MSAPTIQPPARPAPPRAYTVLRRFEVHDEMYLPGASVTVLEVGEEKLARLLRAGFIEPAASW